MSEAKYRKTKTKGGKLLPALCNIIGMVLLLGIIAASLSILIPQFMGYSLYNVVSGSMEPQIPVGSLIIVEPASALEIAEGDIMAFQSGDSVICHRVVRNNTVEGRITTKGDANDGEDLSAVSYDQVIGRVVRHIPAAGQLLALYTSTVGKVYMILLALSGLMFNLLAGRLRARRRVRELKAELESIEQRY